MLMLIQELGLLPLKWRQDQWCLWLNSCDWRLSSTESFLVYFDHFPLATAGLLTGTLLCFGSCDTPCACTHTHLHTRTNILCVPASVRAKPLPWPLLFFLHLLFCPRLGEESATKTLVTNQRIVTQSIYQSACSKRLTLGSSLYRWYRQESRSRSKWTFNMYMRVHAHVVTQNPSTTPRSL